MMEQKYYHIAAVILFFIIISMQRSCQQKSLLCPFKASRYFSNLLRQDLNQQNIKSTKKMFKFIYPMSNCFTLGFILTAHCIKVYKLVCCIRGRGTPSQGCSCLPRVAPKKGKNDLEKILSPESKIVSRYAILWPICRLFCFINFFCKKVTWPDFRFRA